MSKSVCYIAADAGSARLLCNGVESAWCRGEPCEDGPVVDADSAAAWVVQQLRAAGAGLRLDTVCVGVEGSQLRWVAAPNAAKDVVSAVVHKEDASWGTPEPGRYLEPLTAPEGGPRWRRFLLRRPVEPARTGAAVRTGAIVAPDAPVRLLLDGLDRAGVGVGEVLSLWHALCRVWCRPPGRFQGAAGASPGAPLPVPGDGVVFATTPGRLVWAWASCGAGAQNAPSDASGGRAAEAGAGSDGAQGSPVGSKPVKTAGPGLDDRLAALCAAGEVGLAAPDTAASGIGAEPWGRLGMDWLAWGARLSGVPGRVTIVSPQADTDAGVFGGRWPEFSIDAVVEEDPVGAVLQSLAQGEPVAAVSADPTRRSVGLTCRPTRTHRRMHLTLAAGLAVVTIGFLAYGVQYRAERRRLAGEAAELRAKAAELLDTVRPGLTTRWNRSKKTPPQTLANSELAAIRQANQAVEPPPQPMPLAQELARALQLAADIEGVEVGSADMHQRQVSNMTFVKIGTFADFERLRDAVATGGAAEGATAPMLQWSHVRRGVEPNLTIQFNGMWAEQVEQLPVGGAP